jgi:hypothetical protein
MEGKMSTRKKITALAIVLILAFGACNLPVQSSQPQNEQQSQEPPADQETDPQEEPASEEPPTEPEQDPVTQPETETEEAGDEETVTEEPVSDCTPDSEFVDDITIPDGTLVEPGETITKTWRIRNDGTCTWTSAFVWEQVNYDDTVLKASSRTMPMPTDIAPGDTYDISVQLTLPANAKLGSLQVARFQMRSPGGGLFGTHPFASVFVSPGTGICPIGNADQATFINTTERFCFLYPKDYEAYVGATNHTVTRSQPTPGVNEEILSSVSIGNEGGTGGLNLNQWTNQMVNAWKAPSTTPDVDNVQVGGMSAKQTDDLPGMVGNRIIFLVHGGYGYVFTVLPVDDAFGDKKADALALWEMVRTSFTFFNP